MTYAELRALALALAGRLAGAGIGRASRVAFRGAGSIAAMASFLAAMRVGAALPLPPSAAATDILTLRQFRPDVVLVERGDGALEAAAHRAGIPCFALSRLGGEDASRWGGDVGIPNRRSAAGDLALILQSSGTTGRPRGVPRTHRNLLAAAAAYEACLGRTAMARGLVVTALAFGMGGHAVVAALCCGGSVIPAAGLPPLAIQRAIARWQPTWALIVPAVLAEVLQAASELGGIPSSPWQAVGLGGMAASPGLARQAAEALAAPLLEGFGCGEAGLIAGGWDESSGWLNRVFVPGIATVDDAGVATAPGEPGEIVVWGPQVSAGYLDDAAATARAFGADGSFRTGDLGVLDGAGRLRLTGRVKEVINRGGEKLAPAEIDAALLAHPAVAEAAAFAMPDARLGEEVAAAVVLRPGAQTSERQLRRALAACLAPAKVPRRIWFVTSLPRTGTGKVRRGELRRRCAGQGGDAVAAGNASGAS